MSQAPALIKNDTSLSTLVKQPRYADRFTQVLGERAPQFVSSLLSVGSALYDVEPKSIIAAAMIAAALDLPIDKNLGFAWIVPYRDGQTKYAQCQIGWKGFVNLALRSGFYDQMNASPINAEAYKGRDKMGNAIIDWDAVDETKEPVGYAFAWKLINAKEPVVRYWSVAKVKAHAERYSQAYRKGKDTPWKTHFDQMAIKTIVKNELSDWGILSIAFQKALAVDQGVVKDVDAEVQYLDNAPRGELDDKRPQFNGPDDDQIPGAEVPSKPQEPSGTAQTTSDPPQEQKNASTATPLSEAATPAEALPSEPYPALVYLCKRDGITEDELLAHARDTLKMAKKDQKLNDLSTAKLDGLVKGWQVNLAVIKGNRNQS